MLEKFKSTERLEKCSSRTVIEHDAEEDNNLKYPPQDFQSLHRLSIDRGSAPTDHDQAYGSYINNCCERYEVPQPKEMPTVPNTGVESLNANGKPYEVCGGNVNWTTCKTARSSIDLSEPDQIWYITADGHKICRWQTPSRTRSRTLLSWQTLPTGASFDEADLVGESGIGPAWSCLNRSGQHDEKPPIFDFSSKICPLCKQACHTRNTMVHDFAVAKRSTHNYHLDNIPTSVGAYSNKRKRA